MAETCFYLRFDTFSAANAVSSTIASFSIQVVTCCLFLAIFLVCSYALLLRRKGQAVRRIVGLIFPMALFLRLLDLILDILERWIWESDGGLVKASIATLWLNGTSQFLFLTVFLLPICTNLQTLSEGPTKIVKTINRVILGVLAAILLAYLSLSSYHLDHTGGYLEKPEYGEIAKLQAAYIYIFFFAVAEGTVLNIFALKRVHSNFNALRNWVFLTCFWLIFFSLTDVVQYSVYCLPLIPDMSIDNPLAIFAILYLTGPLAAASMLGVALNKAWTLDDPYQNVYDLDNTNLAFAVCQEPEGQEISQVIEHRDAFGRQFRVRRENQDRDHFLRPYDGRLEILRVQVVDPVALPDDRSVGWTRVRMNTKTTPLNKVLYWTWSGTQSKTGTQGKFNDGILVLKWIPSCIAMLVLFCIPQSIGGETRNGGFYDPVRDKDRYYSRAARNPYEDNPQGERAQRLGLQADSEEREPFLQHSHTDLDQCLSTIGEGEDNRSWGLASRPLRPRFLCFLNEETASPNNPEQSFEVREGDTGNEEYIFISFTRRTFCIEEDVCPENPEWAIRDRADVLRFAVNAAREAAVPAFWIDFKCVAQDTVAKPGQGNRDVNEDVYRICDVLRGAHSMVVINGPPYDNKQGQFTEKDRKAWLYVWASRLWVLPELLLAPAEHRIWLYTQEPGIAPEDIVPERIAKRNLAWRSCVDAEDVRQLVDHYEGTVQLSRLELVHLALDCLQRRGTKGRTNADLAYALKGLLRRRPTTIPGESGFEAFASLSLANDSQRLLERLICMLPPRPNVDWSDMRDAWGMKLWDIEPKCQVAGIVDDRTILLDGAYGASIQWGRLETVAFMKRSTASRTVGRILVRITPALFIFGVLFVAPSQGLNVDGGSNPFLIIGAIILAVSGLIILAAPWILRVIYLGKFWSSQAWFFGIEGAVDDLAKIESALFGLNQNRLTWSTNGSVLSRHHINQFQECEAEAPRSRNMRDDEASSSDENAAR